MVISKVNFEEVAGKLIRFKPQRDLREMRLSYIIDNNAPSGEVSRVTIWVMSSALKCRARPLIS